MKISYWPNSIALNGKQPYDAMLQSLSRIGYTLEKENLNSDAAIIWSVLWHGRMLPNQRVWNHYRNQNKPVIVIEVGGIKRGITWKVGLNGVNRSAFFYNSNNDSSRANSIGLKLTPWRQDGEFILICGQHNKSLQWEKMKPLSLWFTETIDQIQSVSQRPIIIRPHPRCRVEGIESQFRNVYRQDPIHITGTHDDFDLSFNRVWATVSWNSNPGPQSILAGIPAYVGVDSLAYTVGNSDLSKIEQPLMPDRQQWLNDYAWTEYTVEEIAAGLPLSRLRQTLETNIINAMV